MGMLKEIGDNVIISKARRSLMKKYISAPL